MIDPYDFDFYSGGSMAVYNPSTSFADSDSWVDTPSYGGGWDNYDMPNFSTPGSSGASFSPSAYMSDIMGPPTPSFSPPTPSFSMSGFNSTMDPFAGVYGPQAVFNPALGVGNLVSSDKGTTKEKTSWYQEPMLWVGLAGVMASIYGAEKNLEAQQDEADKARAHSDRQLNKSIAANAALQSERLNQGGGSIDTSGSTNALSYGGIV